MCILYIAEGPQRERALHSTSRIRLHRCWHSIRNASLIRYWHNRRHYCSLWRRNRGHYCGVLRRNRSRNMDHLTPLILHHNCPGRKRIELRGYTCLLDRGCLCICLRLWRHQRRCYITCFFYWLRCYQRHLLWIILDGGRHSPRFLSFGLLPTAASNNTSNNCEREQQTTQ